MLSFQIGLLYMLSNKKHGRLDEYEQRVVFQFVSNLINPFDNTKLVEKLTIQFVVGGTTKRQLLVWLELDKDQLIFCKCFIRAMPISLYFYTVLCTSQNQFKILKNLITI